MSQYNTYNALPSISNATAHQYQHGPLQQQHQQQPRLTPLANLPLLSAQQDSPTRSQILPPLHSNGNASGSATSIFKHPSAIQPAHHQSSFAHDNRHYSAGLSLPQMISTQDQPSPHASSTSMSTSTYPTYSTPMNTNGLVMPAGSSHAMNASLPQMNSAGWAPYERSETAQSYSGPQSMQRPQQLGPTPENRPLPVVGHQGRRGVLPSASGQAPAPGSVLDGSSRSGFPHKNSDGKFPCQYCDKTYLHLKHLKRHHLRHTGERPYQCCLCYETFCRSDILKRHFGKCAQRRGNPDGASHLTHAQAHLRGGRRSAPNSAGGQDGPIMSTMSGPPSSFRAWPANGQNGNGASHSYSNFNDHAHPTGTITEDSNRSSRSSSILRPGSSSSEDRKRFSTASTITSVNASIEASPTNPQVDERSFTTYNYSGEPFNGNNQRDSHAHDAYSSAPSAPSLPYVSAPEHSQPMQYNRGPFDQYQGNHAAPMHQNHWAGAFQPGGQDTMFGAGQ